MQKFLFYNSLVVYVFTRRRIEGRYIIIVGKNGNLISGCLTERDAQFKFEMQMSQRSLISTHFLLGGNASKLEVKLKICLARWCHKMFSICSGHWFAHLALLPISFDCAGLPIIHTFSHVSKSSRGQAMLDQSARP